jgi:hypothetical protein
MTSIGVPRRKRMFCCDASRDTYERYYSKQAGGDIVPYVGRRRQRGHGLGSIVSGLFRRFVVPFVRANVKTVGSNLLHTGTNIARDVFAGRKLTEAAKEHVPSGIKRTVQSLQWQSPPQPPPAKKQKKTKKKKKKVVVKKGRGRDIFS